VDLKAQNDKVSGKLFVCTANNFNAFKKVFHRAFHFIEGIFVTAKIFFRFLYRKKYFFIQKIFSGSKMTKLEEKTFFLDSKLKVDCDVIFFFSDSFHKVWK
jgi:hypothetical protein